jgi:putative thioredoxin
MSPSAVETLTVTTATFMQEVVEASHQLPVLVDFWAPWCGPCRQLMPTLDRLATEYAGRFRLAKVNTDEEQALATQVGIRSLPTVVLFKGGNAVEHFSGVVPESQIRALLDKHLPAAPPSQVDEVRRLIDAGDYTGARTLLKQRIARDEGNVELRAQHAELLVLDGLIDEARGELDALIAREPRHAAVRRLTALLDFSAQAAAFPDVKALRERVAADPTDLEAVHAVAVHQLLGGDVEPALQTWMNMLRDQPKYSNGLAQRSLLHAFELTGEADPIVGQTRRAMARLLF